MSVDVKYSCSVVIGVFVKLILLKDNTSNIKSFSIGGGKLITAAISLFLILPMIAGLSAYYLPQYSNNDSYESSDLDSDLIEARKALDKQRASLKETEAYIENHLNALGVKMGSLQAQVSRINAVEQRLAVAAGVDLSTFNFAENPGIGESEPSEINLTETELKDAMSELDQTLRAREAEIESLGMMLSAITLKKEQTPSGMPVEGGWISSGFGHRSSPISGHRQFHKGIDIPGRTNQDIIAVADGVVSRSETSGHYGWVVEVNHGDGYTTVYAHNNENIVKVGDVVDKGQVIAKLGSTGRSTGPHVHFEVKKNGKAINPSKYIR